MCINHIVRSEPYRILFLYSHWLLIKSKHRSIRIYVHIIRIYCIRFSTKNPCKRNKSLPKIYLWLTHKKQNFCSIVDNDKCSLRSVL